MKFLKQLSDYVGRAGAIRKARLAMFAGAIALPLGACDPTSISSITTSVADSAIAVALQVCAAYPTITSLIALANEGIALEGNALGAAFCAAIGAATPVVGHPTPAAVRAQMPAAVYVCAGQICGWKVPVPTGN